MRLNFKTFIRIIGENTEKINCNMNLVATARRERLSESQHRRKANWHVYEPKKDRVRRSSVDIVWAPRSSHTLSYFFSFKTILIIFICTCSGKNPYRFYVKTYFTNICLIYTLSAVSILLLEKWNSLKSIIGNSARFQSGDVMSYKMKRKTNN